MLEPIVLSWSGGKDSAYALFRLLSECEYKVKYLLTTIYKPLGRVSMHGVPEALIEAQASAIGIPLKKLYIKDKSNEAYEENMKKQLLEFKTEGITKVAFGDIFLEDLRNYRESRLSELDMEALFPLWQSDTGQLSRQFIQDGFKTHICSIHADLVDESLIGLDYNYEFLSRLNTNIDPCGENGEFHSFCYDGPLFKERVNFSINGHIEKIYEHNNDKYRYLFSDISL